MKIADAKLLYLDLEATGTDPAKAYVIQYSFQLMQGTRVLYTLNSLVKPPSSIPEEVVELTGITDEMVRGAKRFRDHASVIQTMFYEVDAFVGYNLLKYDLILLAEELLRAGEPIGDLWKKPVIDAGSIFMQMEPRTLSAAYKFFTGQEMANCHDASADVAATVRVMESEVAKYSLQDKTLAELTTLSRYGKPAPPDVAGKLQYDEQGRVCFGNFGKFRNAKPLVPITDDVGYCDWMLDKDFPESTKLVIRQVLKESRDLPPIAEPHDIQEIPF